jgi:hypothetical protein
LKRLDNAALSQWPSAKGWNICLKGINCRVARGRGSSMRRRRWSWLCASGRAVQLSWRRLIYSSISM